MTKMKTSTEGLNGTVKRKEEGISEPEDSTMKLKIHWKKNQRSLKHLWDHNKNSNVYITEVLE